MEFSKREYWTGLPFPSPGDLPNPGLKPRSPALQADFLPFKPQGKPRIIAIRPFNLGKKEHPNLHVLFNYAGKETAIKGFHLK